MRPDRSTWRILRIAPAVLGAVVACAGGERPPVTAPGTINQTAFRGWTLKTNEVLTIPGAGSGVGITYGDGFIWASTGTGIAQIDPESRSIVREILLGSGWFYELIWDDGLIWASTTTKDVLKVDPYR